MADTYWRDRAHYLEDQRGNAAELIGAVTGWTELAARGTVTPEQALEVIRDALAKWQVQDAATAAAYAAGEQR